MRKYIQFLAIVSPLVIAVVLVFLSHVYPVIDYALVIAFFTGITWLFYKFQKLRKTFQNVMEGQNIPKKLAEFPVYETNYEEYRIVRQRVEFFVKAVEDGRDAELEINANDINCLRNKGITATRSGSNALSMPEYYEIKKGEVYESAASFFPFNPDFYESFTSKICFVDKDGLLSESKIMILRDDKSVAPRQYLSTPKSLAQSKLLDCILRLDKTIEWKESMILVLSKLSQIEVIDEKLILRAQNHQVQAQFNSLIETD